MTRFLNIPGRAGRYLYHEATLPRPRAVSSGGGSFEEPLVVAGMFRTSNGIGRAAMACHSALSRQGHRPIAVDLAEMFNQVEHAAAEAIEPMPQSRSGTLLLFANAPETRRALIGLGLRRWHNWRIIGCWAWELPAVPPDWPRNARYLSEVWVPSQFVAESLGPDFAKPVKTVPHHVPVPDMRPLELPCEVTGAPFRMLCSADGRSSFHRKNIMATVRAFLRAFEGDPEVELIVKCRNLEQFPEFARELKLAESNDARIRLLTHTMTGAEMTQLVRETDLIVSTHRSEGFGLVLAEAMALGKPVMATGWSGNLQFMTESNSRLLPYELESVSDPTGIYNENTELKWARVDEDATIRAMRELRQSAEYRYTLAERARQDVAKSLDGGVYQRALMA